MAARVRTGGSGTTGRIRRTRAAPTLRPPTPVRTVRPRVPIFLATAAPRAATRRIAGGTIRHRRRRRNRPPRPRTAPIRRRPPVTLRRRATARRLPPSPRNRPRGRCCTTAVARRASLELASMEQGHPRSGEEKTGPGAGRLQLNVASGAYRFGWRAGAGLFRFFGCGVMPIRGSRRRAKATSLVATRSKASADSGR